MTLFSLFSRRHTPEISPLGIAHQTLLWLTLSYLLLVIPLYPQLNLFIYLVAIGTIGGRYVMHRRQLKPPRRLVLNGLAIVSGLFIIPLWWYGGLLESMINLLVLGTSLKFLEFHARRDIGIHILALFFLGGVLFIYQQEIQMAIYLLLAQLLCLATLLSLYQPCRWSQQLKMAGKLLLQSLPVMLLLFVLMPRLAPLWQMPDAKLASTGLNERIAPEDITRLAQSGERVFRATFDNEPPQALYWRVLVHEWFDGHTWNVSPTLASWFSAAKTAGSRVAGRFQPPRWQGTPIHYELLPDPNNQHWIFALERSVADSDELVMSPYQGLFSRLPLTQAKQFSLSYYPQAAAASVLPPQERSLNLQLPRGGNPQSRDLARQWREQSHSDAEVAQRAMAFYRDQGLTYTLTPPALTGDSLDQLLFSTKQGFCAHFASSFAFLMRAAGIPARLVSGYLGGEYDAQARFLTVYQYDAHAWVELWLDGHWQRFDPTVMVAPGRLGLGVTQLIPDAAALTDGALSLNRYRSIPLLNELRLFLAQMDFRWSSWVLNFNGDKQAELLGQWWGKSSLARFWTLLCGTLLSLGAAWLIHRLWQRGPRQDPLLRRYLEICTLLEKAGAPRQRHETPSHYAERLATLGHPAAALLGEITAIFTAARYQPSSAPEISLGRLQKLHVELKISIKSDRYKNTNKNNNI